MARVVFITGTDTGAGKTVLTALLLVHAQSRGIKVRAIKPICTGDRADAQLLSELQNHKLPLEQINPLFFKTPVAPLVAARLENAHLGMSHLMAVVLSHDTECDLLLVEGAGGLLSPLGEGFSLADLVQALGPEVIVAAQNKLGVLNHLLLTCEALKPRSRRTPRIALIESEAKDPSQNSNASILRELLPTNPFVEIHRLADITPAGIKKASTEQAEALKILLKNPA